MYRVKSVLIIVFEILVSSTPLAHSFRSVLFTGLAQNVCPFERVLLPNSFSHIFSEALSHAAVHLLGWQTQGAV